LNKELLGYQFGRPIQVLWSHRLVGAHGEDSGDIVFESGGDDVARAINVRLDSFYRIVLTRRYLLESGGVDNDVNTLRGTDQTALVSNVANEVPQARIVESGDSHLVLFQFISAKNDQLPWPVVAEQEFSKLLAERSCASRDEYGGAFPCKCVCHVFPA